MKIEGIHAISATDVLPQPPPAVFRVNTAPKASYYRTGYIDWG